MKPNEVKQQNKVALLIIDMINMFDFPQGKELMIQAKIAAQNIHRLKQRLSKKKIPVIYLNDNFGQWRSDLKEVYARCTQDGCLGKEIATLLKPEHSDFFVLKPRHSGFYSTSLDILLKDLGVKKLVVTGVAGNICVFFTVNDAHMRDFKIWVPQDCVASNTKKDNNVSLDQMKKVLGVRTASSEAISSFLK